MIHDLKLVTIRNRRRATCFLTMLRSQMMGTAKLQVRVKHYLQHWLSIYFLLQLYASSEEADINLLLYLGFVLVATGAVITSVGLGDAGFRWAVIGGELGTRWALIGGELGTAGHVTGRWSCACSGPRCSASASCSCCWGSSSAAAPPPRLRRLRRPRPAWRTRVWRTAAWPTCPASTLPGTPSAWTPPTLSSTRKHWNTRLKPTQTGQNGKWKVSLSLDAVNKCPH